MVSPRIVLIETILPLKLGSTSGMLIYHPFTKCDISGVEYFYEFLENSHDAGIDND
jgi:hypothetical protein